MFNTRIAPSPTGDLHLGTVRTAYFNWLAARASGGKFILRIDDTDRARSEDRYTNAILDTLTWLGLNWDELHFQSHRFDRHRLVADQWLKAGLARRDEKGNVRVDTTLAEAEKPLPREWVDIVGGIIKISDDDRATLNGITMVREDGTPTYQWASVVDDMDLGVNLIIRGTDHITNTSKQVCLWHMLGFDAGMKFAHVGLIGQGGKLLSKRDGSMSMRTYMDKGYDPDAVLNCVARLGWGPTVDDKSTALLPKERMLQLFLTGGKMLSKTANFDPAKLDSFDRKYKARKGTR